jgi:hypothetical protein
MKPLAAAAFIIVSAIYALGQCISDAECKGDRLCVNGQCVDPASRGSAAVEQIYVNTGEVEIELRPAAVDLYIDDRPYGKGSRTTRLSAGTHRITARLGAQEKTYDVLVEDGGRVSVALEFGSPRNVFWGFSTDFAWTLGNHAGAFGPMHNAGVYANNHYAGLTFIWGFGDVIDNGYSQIFGGGFVYAYEFQIRKAFAFSLGATSGYWDNWGHTYTSDCSNSSCDEWWDADLLGGPLIKLRVGNKPVFFKSDLYLLIGPDAVRPLLSNGVKFIF